MSENNSPVPRKAGRRPRFSADDVVAAALRVGLDRFTVTSVARELGVTNAAIYRRYPSHHALLDVCIDRILSEVAPLTGDLSWQETLRRGAAEWAALCQRYPGLSTVAGSSTGPIDRFIAGPFRSYSRRLLDLGFTRTQSAFVASMIISAVNQVQRFPGGGDPDDLGDGADAQARVNLVVDIIVAGLAGGWPEWRATSDSIMVQAS